MPREGKNGQPWIFSSGNSSKMNTEMSIEIPTEEAISDHDGHLRIPFLLNIKLQFHEHHQLICILEHSFNPFHKSETILYIQPAEHC